MKSDFIIALTQLAAERNLSKDIVLSAIEAALASAYRRDSVAAGQNITVSLDPNTGEVTAAIVKTVVDEVTDSQTEISLSEAKQISPIADLGDNVPIGALPQNTGRIAAMTAKQVVIQRLRDAERELVFKEYADKVGEVYTVSIQKVELGRHVTVELGRAEAILPMAEQSPYDRYRVGQRYKVLLKSIEQSARGPEIVVSRADKALVRRLFEQEVPEIFNGAVEIVGIAREAGSRSKVAVFAKQDGVDAVGSCVGLRGIRIQNIVNELHGEKIDVVEWSRDPTRFVKNSLSPAVALRVQVDLPAGSATAVVSERQLSLAIGKEGQNARLAAKLTGLRVDIISDIEAAQIETERAKTASQEAAAARAAAKDAPAAQEEAPDAVAVPTPKPDTPAVEEPAVEILQPAASIAVEPMPAAAAAAPPPDAPPPEAPVLVEAPALVEAPTVEAPAAVDGEYAAPEILEELLEIDEAPQAPPAEEATPLHDLPEDIWNINQGGRRESGVIRFAEDIEELAARGPRGGGGRRRRGGGRRRGPARRR